MHAYVMQFRLLITTVFIFLCLPAIAGDKNECDASVSDFNTSVQLSSSVVNAHTKFDFQGSVTPAQLELWSKETVATFESTEGRSQDIIIYIHGFMTSSEQALCNGLNLENTLRSLDRYSGAEVGATLVTFAWPSDLSAQKFSEGQARAAYASIGLASLILEAWQNPLVGNVVLVAHSLGAQVAMDALSNLSATNAPPGSIKAVVLVQGAIPAVSIRSWRGAMEIRHPSLELWCLVRDDIPCRPPITLEHGSGLGTYAYSSLIAEHLIITTSEKDSTLWRWFGLDELHRPSDGARPETTVVPGRIFPNGDVKALAIGNPFPEGRAYNVFEPVMVPKLEDYFARREGKFEHQNLELSPNPMDVLEETTITYTFELNHPGYQEIRLETLPEPVDWHSPLATNETREPLIEQIWQLVFDTGN